MGGTVVTLLPFGNATYAGAGAGSGTGKRRLVIEDFFALKFVSDVQIAPDGERIAYVLSVVDKEADDYRSAIWLAAAAGGGGAGSARGGAPLRFTAGLKKDASPRWSPDGQTLAFLSDRAGKNQVFLIAVDGGESRQLTNAANGAANPVWSPDGKFIAFTTRTGPEDNAAGGTLAADGGVAAVVAGVVGGVAAAVAGAAAVVGGAAAVVGGAAAVVGGAGSGAKDCAKTDPLVVTRLKYKADGRGLLDGRRNHLWVVPVEGGEARQVTFGDFDDGDPAWSPDGRWLAFSSNRTEDWDLNNLSDIWVVAADGREEPLRVTAGAGPSGSPAWSPDGMWIAYVGHDNRYFGSTYARLYLTSALGGTPRDLTAGFDHSVGSVVGSDMRSVTHNGGAVWTSDGKYIHFTAGAGGTCGLYRADVAAGTVAPVLTGPFALVAVSLDAKARRVAYAATDMVTPADVWVYDLGGATGEGAGVAGAGDGVAGAGDGVAGAVRLTRVNGDLLSAVELSVPEAFRFPSTDGLGIEGWVMRPIRMIPGRTYPAVLEIHGGPHAAWGHAFFMEFQLLAAQGYAVIFTNPRGSGNYGQDFTRAVVGDWGGKDYEDLMAAVDHVLGAYGFVSPNRLGVTGGSYGGFMTNWIIGHTNRFAAAVTQRSVVNRHSFYGTSDIGALFGDHHFHGNPWDDPNTVLDRSPLQYVANIRTPLLILHSEEDHRCPIGQAEELFTALRRQKKTVEFVRFPGEGHELSRSGKPGHRIQRYQRITGWFEKHLPVKVKDYAW
jgi:dipeptidyl aminopeptidase/acylaminoacyl peptidase